MEADALGWATACASSRAFRVRGPDHPAAFLPLIDVANHAFDASAVVRPDPDDDGAVELVAARRVLSHPGSHTTASAW